MHIAGELIFLATMSGKSKDEFSEVPLTELSLYHIHSLLEAENEASWPRPERDVSKGFVDPKDTRTLKSLRHR